MDPFDLKKWPGFYHAAKDQFISETLIDQIVIDSRRINSAHSLFIALEGDHDDGHRFISHAALLGARFAIVKENYVSSEDLGSMILLKVEKPLTALQEIASIYRSLLNIPIIAIAGSYGKTLTKDLLHAFLKQTLPTFASPESFNSQIGVPLSLLSMRSTDQLALIEVGFSKIGELETLAEVVKPNFAIITHVKETYLSSLKNLATIIQQKMKLAEKIPESGWLLAPSEISTEQSFQNLKVQKIFWNQNCPYYPHAHLAFFNEEEICYQIDFPDGTSFIKSIPEGLPYMVDLINICLKGAWQFKVAKEDILEVLNSYIPESMQTEVWTSPQGATFINDVYSADPISIGKALKNLPQTPPEARRIFFFDGLKNQMPITERDFKHIGEEICHARIHQLILVGHSDFSHLINKVTLDAPKTEISVFADRKEAFKQIRQRIKRDDLVLIKGSRKDSLNTIAKELTDIVKDNRLVINLGAIRSNIAMIRSKLVPQTRIMAMVKAMAYGTDQVIIGKFLKRCGIDILGVAHVDEAISLRAGGIQQAIFVINAAIYEVSKLVSYDFEVGVSDLPLIEKLAQEALKQGKRIKVHLHVDTGMSRLGCRPEEALHIAEYIQSRSSLELEGLMTHFSAAENPQEDNFTQGQCRIFFQISQILKEHGIIPRWLHASNSSGALRFDCSQFNMVRIGLALYGLQSSQATKEALKLRMALCLKSKIAGINHCRTGDTISYGRSYTVKNPEEKIGVIPLGYFDGFHRHYSGKGYVIVKGQKAPMVGTICMDFMMVDITHIPKVKAGDHVLIFGEDEYGNFISPEEFALNGNTNVHELVTCLGPRIQRLFIDDEK